MDWQRLADEVISRRVHLGYPTRQEFTDATGFAPRTLGDIERCRRQNFDRVTRAKLEQALQWPPGAVDAILAGDAVVDGAISRGQQSLPGGVPSYLGPGWAARVTGHDLPPSDNSTVTDQLAELLAADSPIPESLRSEVRGALASLVSALQDRAAAVMGRPAEEAERIIDLMPAIEVHPPVMSTGRALDAYARDGSGMEAEDRSAIREGMRALMRLGDTALLAYDAKYGLKDAERRSQSSHGPDEDVFPQPPHRALVAWVPEER